MKTPNPYESPATQSESQPRSWRWIDFFATGLWIIIPIAVFAGRQLLLPVFDDFDIEVPISSQYLLSFYSPVLLAIASFIVLLGMFTVPHGTTRRGFVWAATVFGILVGVLCVLAIVLPLFSLWRGLS